jgi:hypothetical protein
MICELCHSILQHRAGLIKETPKFHFFAHHATPSSLRDSAAQGCYLCLTFCNEMFDSDQGLSMSSNLTNLVTHFQLSERKTGLNVTTSNAYNVMIMLAEDTNLSNLNMRKGTGSIFVLQPSSGRFEGSHTGICGFDALA